MTPNKKNGKSAARPRQWGLALGFTAAVLGLPVQAALTIPDSPLQADSAVAPNIMFILDDSSSMGLDFMPSLSTGSCDIETINQPSSMSSTQKRDISCKAYTANTLYYNPAVEYKPWMTDVKGARLADATYNSALTSNDDYLVPGSSSTNLADAVQTFYVPVNTSATTGLDNKANFYRYQIRSGANGQVVRAEWKNSVDANAHTPTQALAPVLVSAGRNEWIANTYTVDVPAGMATLEVKISGNDPDANVYVRQGSAPDSDTYKCFSNDTDSNETCVINNPSGKYYIRVKAANTNSSSAFAGVELSAQYNTSESALGCATSGSGLDWRNCKLVTPTNRTVDAEKQNYANWYVYSRTRMKSAKAGASEAFNGLGTNLRIGFANIHNESRMRIPVGNADKGLFMDVSRKTWFDTLHAENVVGTSYTPLRSGLAAIGEYYKDKSATGPWGPGATADDQLSCRQNFAILTTDGYWNKNDEPKTNPYPAGNHDGIDGPNGYLAKTPFSDSFSTTLADVAMYYWKNDLRTDMTDNVRTTDTPWQHMVTFSISIGLVGTINPSSLANVTWPNPDPGSTAGNEYGIDDLLHAAVNGHGTFAVANNPSEFAAALRNAFDKITAETASGSSVSLSSTSVQDNTRAFVAQYKPTEWYGELLAYPVKDGKVQAGATWSASKTVSKVKRDNVYTLGTGGGGKPVTFPTTAQKDILTDGVANYLLGDRSGETTTPATYRPRTSLLGDIVNSSPAYVVVGSGTAAVETVYVGANDGMLHALDAATGAERFNYVPNLVDMAKLKNLSVVKEFAHQFFVDGPIVVSNRRQTPDKNYLVGTLGRGGKGVYGLNVTDPTKFSSTGGAWEYNGAAIADDRKDMGLVLSKPLIVALNNGEMGAIVSNGVNSERERAVLFVLNLTTGALIRKVETLTPTDPSNNGLSAPTGVDSDGNGTVDYVYAGDLQGNVWKFDLSNTDSTKWAATGKNGPTPLFTAKDKDTGGKVQPITGGVTISFNPYTFEPWVFFGTGRFMTTSDTTDKSIQTWYGFADNGTPVAGRSELVQRDITKAGEDAKKRPIRAFEEATAGDMDGKVGWYIDLVLKGGTAEGERMIGNQVVAGGTVLLASSIIPEASGCNPTGKGYVNAVDLFTGAALSSPFFDLDDNGGFSLWKTVDNKQVLSDGMMVGDKAVAVGSVDLGVGMPSDPTVMDNLVVVGGSKGTTGTIGIARLIQNGRISWREILKD